jgi:hypothetical protein
LGAILGVLGYLAKSVVDWWKKREREKTALKDTLTRLYGLLQESKSLFVTQNELARRLLKNLYDNHPEEDLGERGFERTFSRLYEKFSPEERDLHSIIRGITTNSLLRVNTDMSAWLKEDLLFKSGSVPVPNAKEVAEYLKRLNRHLNSWHDKYKVWITNDSRHAFSLCGRRRTTWCWVSDRDRGCHRQGTTAVEMSQS